MTRFTAPTSTLHGDNAQSPGRERTVVPVLAAAVVLATAVHWLFYAHGFYGISWDDAGRTIDAYRWSRDPAILHATVWLPFHRIVVGTALQFHPDLFVTPRVVTFFFGLAALATVTWMAAELFRDRRVASATALLGALFTPRVVVALAPLSTTPFVCITLAAMAALARWLRTATRASLLLAALGFALSTTVRYEGWIFAAVFGLVVLARWWSAADRATLTDLLLSGAVVSAFPLFWMYLHATQNGSPLAFLAEGSTPFPDWVKVGRKNPLTEFLVLNGITLNLIGLWSAVSHARVDRRFRQFLFVAAAPLLLVATALLVGKRAQSGPSWRMIAVWSLLLLPFTADVIVALGHRLPRFGRVLAGAALAGLSLLYMVDTRWLWQQSRWAIPEASRTIGRELNGLLATRPPETRVLIESSTFSYLNILVSSQHPDRFVLNSVPERADDPAALLAVDRPLPIAELEREDIRFLVFRTPALRDSLNRQPALRRVADFDDWTVYERR